MDLNKKVFSFPEKVNNELTVVSSDRIRDLFKMFKVGILNTQDVTAVEKTKCLDVWAYIFFKLNQRKIEVDDAGLDELEKTNVKEFCNYFVGMYNKEPQRYSKESLENLQKEIENGKAKNFEGNGRV